VTVGDLSPARYAAAARRLNWAYTTTGWLKANAAVTQIVGKG